MPQGLLAVLTTIGLSMLPVVEARGAIPAGMAMGLPLWPAFLIAFAASCVPAVPILYFLKPVMAWLRRTKALRRVVGYIDRKADKSVAKVLRSKYVYWALFLFVAVPLPGTGVWTGALAASALGLRIRYSLGAIWAGNLVACLSVMLLSYTAFLAL